MLENEGYVIFEVSIVCDKGSPAGVVVITLAAPAVIIIIIFNLKIFVKCI